jgi:hypothetical protein
LGGAGLQASSEGGGALEASVGELGAPSAASLAFASQPLDTLSAAQALTVTNTGHGVLQIARAQVTTGAIDDFLITADSCSAASLPINASCAIDVRFAPSATAQRSATLSLTSNDTAGPLQILLAGTAAPRTARRSGHTRSPGSVRQERAKSSS